MPRGRRKKTDLKITTKAKEGGGATKEPILCMRGGSKPAKKKGYHVLEKDASSPDRKGGERKKEKKFREAPLIRGKKKTSEKLAGLTPKTQFSCGKREAEKCPLLKKKVRRKESKGGGRTHTP